MANDFLSLLPRNVLFRPKRSIGGFTATVTITETATDELEITQNPVQSGAAITDNAYKKPVMLSINAQWNEVGANMPLSELYDRLLQLQASRQPFDVITGNRIYKNMLFKSLQNTIDRESQGILNINASLQEIIIVNVEVVTVPPRAQQKQPGVTGATEKAGTKKPEPAPEKTSALSRIFG